MRSAVLYQVERRCVLLQVARAGRFGTKGLAIMFVSDESDACTLNDVQCCFEVNIGKLPEEIYICSYSKFPFVLWICFKFIQSSLFANLPRVSLQLNQPDRWTLPWGSQSLCICSFSLLVDADCLYIFKNPGMSDIFLTL